VCIRRILTGGPNVDEAIRNLGRPIPGMFLVEAGRMTDEQAQSILPRSPPLYDAEALTDRSERFVASELVRAALFESLNKELPYCCEVQIDSFREPKEGEKPVVRIAASVIVERDTQKRIVIGKGGEKIKQVGILARQKLEQFLQSKVCATLCVADAYFVESKLTELTIAYPTLLLTRSF
jgi:GTPase Era involved in 16S rRNA processing